MQPYFDPTRKTNSKKMEDDIKKIKKMKTTSTKKSKKMNYKNEDDFNKKEDDLKKNY